MAELDERLELAVAIALESAAIPRRYFLNDGLVVDRKDDNSPVTRADKETEELLRKRIESACPGDAILGEEFADKDGDSGFRWHLDPIDGTESFIRGVPMFGTLIALERGNDAVIGVIAFPALGEIVYAAQGGGAWWATNTFAAKSIADLEQRAAMVSKTAELADALFSNGGLELYAQLGITDKLQRLLAKTKVSRGWSDCYGHYLVATGRVDIMIDPLMHVWDNAPLLPIVSEAGGRFTDLSGNAAIDTGSGLSTNGLLHDAVLKEWHTAANGAPSFGKS